ncbi:four helix bundle protein [Flavobacterium sp. SM2513]|uniref:four helix bundle protein n=1 Tax=Flavobacterium sp. SM2513 TaxID=3424766 RepID=UPI003D7F2A18
MSDYSDLDVYKESLELFFIIHPASLKLPKYEMYELGSQLIRSEDSTVTNIVEGYGRKRYKAEFIRFLVFSHSSCMEAKNHLFKIATLYPDTFENMEDLILRYDNLGAKLYNFISYVDKNWKI